MSRGRERADGGGGRPRSRRGLLAAAAAGGLGVIAGETIAGATPALADNGQPVLQGTDNGTPTARTAVLTANEIGALADPNTAGKGSLGVYGKGQSFGVLGEAATGSGGTGVKGTGDGSGSGVFGTSPGGTGVWGVSGGGVGVVGNGGGIESAGVFGSGSGSGVGVSGSGGPGGGAGVAGSGGGNGHGVDGFGSGTGAGVVGNGGSGSGAAGVIGNGSSAGGDGVIGNGGGSGAGIAGTGGPSNGAGVVGSGPGTGDGVRGTATSGNGVHGVATSVGGVGVLAESTTGNIALRVSGRALFSRSGVLTIAAGASSGTVSGVALTAASLVLATLQQDRSGVVGALGGAEHPRQLVHRAPEQGRNGEHHRGLVRGQLSPAEMRQRTFNPRVSTPSASSWPPGPPATPPSTPRPAGRSTSPSLPLGWASSATQPSRSPP